MKTIFSLDKKLSKTEQELGFLKKKIIFFKFNLVQRSHHLSSYTLLCIISEIFLNAVMDIKF